LQEVEAEEEVLLQTRIKHVSKLFPESERDGPEEGKLTYLLLSLAASKAAVERSLLWEAAVEEAVLSLLREGQEEEEGERLNLSKLEREGVFA